MMVGVVSPWLIVGGLIVMWPGGGPVAVRRAESGYAVKLVGSEAGAR